jgi:hypothetical protein
VPGKVVVIGHGGSDGTTALAFPAEDLIVCYFTQSRGQNTTIRLETMIQENLMRGKVAAAAVPDNLRIPCVSEFHQPMRGVAYLFRYRGPNSDVPGRVRVTVQSL